MVTLQWCTVDIEMKDPTVQNPELKVHPLKPEVGQNIVMHASPTAHDFL